MADWTDIRKVLKEVPDANIYMFHGERSNGKTYSALSYCLDKLVEDGSRFVYVRRLSESLKAQYMRNLFAGNRKTGDLQRHVNKLGWADIGFYSGAFWGTVPNEKGKLIRVDEPCGYTMSISTWETAKGGVIPKAKTIVFDEYLTRGSYFINEPTLFENLISSVFREEGDGKVIMLANTVSWSCPYYREWGLNHVKEMKQGTYDIYQTGDKRRKIVVSYTEHKDNKASDVFFNYDNPRSRMILEGVWETADYPPIPEDISGWYQGVPSYIQSIEEYTLKLVPCATPEGLECLFVFANRRKLIDEDGVDPRYRNRIIYTDYFYPYINCKMALTKHGDRMSQYIVACLKQGRVFYQNNEVGENLRNYIKWSSTYSPIRN